MEVRDHCLLSRYNPKLVASDGLGPHDWAIHACTLAELPSSDAFDRVCVSGSSTEILEILYLRSNCSTWSGSALVEATAVGWFQAVKVAPSCAYEAYDHRE